MFGDDAQCQHEASTTSMPIDKVDNPENHATNHDNENNTRESSGRCSPVSSPSTNFDESETKSSRKREREVSLEPASGSGLKSGAATDSSVHVAKDERDFFRTPAKKNRIYRSVELDATAEEEDNQVSGHHRSRSNSSNDSDTNSPPTTQPKVGFAASPQEMKAKVRQISQGVEDITWRNMNKQRKDFGTDGTDTRGQEDRDGAMAAITEDKGTDDDALVTQAASSSSSSASGRESISKSATEGALNLKRKHPERGPSTEPPSELEPNISSSTLDTLGAGAESSAKRPRDDSDKDDNPRVPKRPTPPPPEEKNRPPIKQASFSGFMAYASTSSPFASIKGQNIFSSSSNSSSSTLSAIKTPLPSSPVLGKEQPLPSAGTKRTGFEAFASSSSPFASVARSKSPVLGGSGIFGSTSVLGGGTRAKSPSRRPAGSPSRSAHSFTTTSVSGSSAGTSAKGGRSAFTVYATGGVQGFALPLTKRARGANDFEDNSTMGSGPMLEANDVFSSSRGGNTGKSSSSSSNAPSFSEKLRAAGKGSEEEDGNEEWDEARPKVNLSEQEVSTGEELEETIHQVRGKLFALVDGAWKERGTGILKLNVRAEDGGGARLVMRKEAVYTLLLNVTLFTGMKCTLAQDPRYVRFSVIENGQQTTHYNLRLANAKIAAELMEAIHENLPAK
ncbi:hypothetical protein GGU10DRAFT_390466 [Lentinula aff. detonsa]|uniref:RanBD1 domain-containing protein n=1 Tax=Lentinula aff. detonsa TaxID=2804958 RepID=A0AA38KDW8_9AGAR|nr:hypothetical protein GGU10DRAFT_390466 [Lentinula aff. detonsa]